MFSKIRVEYLFKNYVIFWGEGGGHQKITLYYKGGGGRSRESKKRLHNFEESLNSMIFFGETIPLNSVLNLAELFHRIAFLFFSIPHPLFLCQVSQRRDSITETWYLKNTWGKNFFRGWNGIFFAQTSPKMIYVFRKYMKISNSKESHTARYFFLCQKHA